MSITVANLQSAGDQFRRSTETADFTAAKSLEAAALAIEDVHSQANFRFTQRRQTFDYLNGEVDYSLLTALNVQDFRAPRDIRNIDNNTQGFDYIDPNQFDVMSARDTRPIWTVEYLDGFPTLRVIQSSTGSYTQIHQASDHDANGTWAADTTNSDALNVSTDSHIYRTNSGSIKFDTDVSQSGNNKATISVSDMTAVDLSAYQGHGIIRMWVYIPDVLDDTSIYVSSIELRWGSDSSNYWSKTVTRPVDNYNFVDRWNLVEFKWDSATETGTVTETVIDYLLVTFNYGASQPDDTGFRINDIRIYHPSEMEFIYFSNYTVKTTSTGIWKARATATTDELLAPDIYKPVYVAAFNYYMARMLLPINNPQIAEYESRYGLVDPNTGKRVGGLIGRMIREQGEREKIPARKLIPQISWSD